MSKLSEEQRHSLVSAADQARKGAYAPYSDYPVGAALVTKGGQLYTGANVENAAYPISMCAERTALFHAVTQGERDFVAIAVVTRDGGTPCGSCRQALSEFGLETVVLVVNEDGDIVQESTVGDLLPGAFGPSNLDAGS